MSNSDEEFLIAFKRMAEWANADFDAETRLFFDSAKTSFETGNFIASILCNLTGIEATLRYAVTPYQENGTLAEPERSDLLSNKLLESAQSSGYPVRLLQFNSETDFDQKLNSKKTRTTEKVNVGIVQLRHNMCHGNLYEFTSEITVSGKPYRQVDLKKIEIVATELAQMAANWYTAYKKHKKSLPDHK